MMWQCEETRTLMPMALDLDDSGTIYLLVGHEAIPVSGYLLVADRILEREDRLVRITPHGTAEYWVHGGCGYEDGPRERAKFRSPEGLAVDASGNVYVADTGNHCIRKVSPDGAVQTLAGTGELGFRNGAGPQAQFNKPNDVAVDTLGNVYVSDTGNHYIRRISPEGQVSTLAGRGAFGFHDGIGKLAKFSSPLGIAVDSQGNVFVADRGNARIRRIDTTGVVSTVAQLPALTRLVALPTGDLLAVDSWNHTIRRITPAGDISLYSGGQVAGHVDGPLSRALFNRPEDLAVTAGGAILVADSSNSYIRRIVPSGFVTTTVNLSSQALGC